MISLCRRRSIGIMFVWLCLSFCSCTSVGRQDAHDTSYIENPSFAEMPPPSTPLGFLKSIKLAAESDAFYSQSTYTNAEKVKNLFSGKIITGMDEEGPTRDAYISDFPASIDPTRETKIVGQQTSFEKSLYISAVQRKDIVRVHVDHIKSLKLSLHDVEALFGQKGDFYPPPDFEPWGEPFRIPSYRKFELHVPNAREAYLVAEYDSMQTLTAVSISLSKELP